MALRPPTDAPAARSLNLLFVTHHRRFKIVYRSLPCAAQLVQAGHRVTLLCVHDRNRSGFAEDEVEGVRIVATPDLLWGRARSGWDPLSAWRRTRWLRGRPFDLIHAFETRPATIHPVLATARRLGVPWVADWIDWWGRGGLIRDQRPAWYRLLLGPLETWYEEAFRTRADAVTVISDGLAERAAGLGVPRERIFKVRDGADLQRFTPREAGPCRARFGVPDSAVVAGFSAADVLLDLPLVLDAMRLAVARRPDLLLLVTGNRPPDWDDRVRRAGLERCTRHLGFLPYDDLPDALGCCDFFLLPFTDRPANRGRWPHKVADYLSMGRPIVTHPVGEMRALLEQEEVGVAAGPGAEGFAHAMLRLCDDGALRTRLATRARPVAETHLHWATIGQTLEACYRWVLRHPRRLP